MLTYPEIDPVIFRIGALQVHWYGLMYVVGFITAWFLASIRAEKPNSGWTEAQVSDLVFYSALGVILGGRIGYILFYKFSDFLAHPLMLFKIWEGGMSFHGGLLGVAVALWLFCRQHHKRFANVADFTAPLVPLGLAAGRIGNFINGELWGRVTTQPWGMIFPNAGPLPRHPSQLYEFFLEGILLFIIIWWYSSRPRPAWAVSGMFLLFYGLFRFIVEFVREPDVPFGFVAFGWLTMGQLLSLPMIIVGLFLLWWSHRQGQQQSSDATND